MCVYMHVLACHYGRVIRQLKDGLLSRSDTHTGKNTSARFRAVRRAFSSNGSTDPDTANSKLTVALSSHGALYHTVRKSQNPLAPRQPRLHTLFLDSILISLSFICMKAHRQCCQKRRDKYKPYIILPVLCIGVRRYCSRPRPPTGAHTVQTLHTKRSNMPC